jgi:acetyl esterase/lipase
MDVTSQLRAAPRRDGLVAASVRNVPAARFGIEITRSIQYRHGERGTLDVYRPRTAAAAPVIVFFYGGSWQTGKKSLYRFLGAALARRGYVAVVPDYRLYPEVRFPEFLSDAALAVRWSVDNAVWFGGDRTKVFLMGHSAGAYIAAMLAIDRRWLRSADLDPVRDISGLIGIAGPYDFLPLRDETLKVIFGGGNQTATQPIAHVTPGAPPALLLTGATDRVVDPGNATRLAARLHASGNDATVVNYPRAGHFSIMAAFAGPLRFLAPALRDTDDFIARAASRRAAAVAEMLA